MKLSCLALLAFGACATGAHAQTDRFYRVGEPTIASKHKITVADASSLLVTTFSVTPEVQSLSLEAFCAADCPPGSSTCPPRQQVRSLAVALSGKAVSDATVLRSVRSAVRLRNDLVTGACPV